ncbi:ABC transporter ATP-binding protein [Mycena sanguinolenta]|uniref:ABC transporter ATP-binding protein n=1 Tax=Mycena sanguinolenta TaxID=230812 RepID=A0A8H6XUG5_9AGAR|nr:ABC transporter ATP-binding protein [Mycena sanguinolenta]
MLARFRSQFSRQQRRTFASRKLPKSKLSHETPPEPVIPDLKANPPKDFRNPWFFKAVGVANFIIIPVVGIYATFYWDWDDEREHVMKPARRWLQKQKDAFFRLSPPEQELATPGLVIPPLDGAESLTSSGSGLSTAGLPKGFFKPFFLVKDVVPEGPAAVAGLREDDLIVSFGETPVRSLAPLTYQAMIKSAVKENTAIPVLVMRPGKQVLLLLTPTTEAGLGCDLRRFQPGQVNR